MEKEKYMWRCIELAKNGLSTVSSNPMVGAVIVDNKTIIGEGYHMIPGGPHAEVNAINSVKDKSRLTQSTLYVNLEPCSHFGKTAPCSQLIIDHKIPKVVIGCKDPFREVSGKGIKQLEEAGIEVIIGVLEKECETLNKRFIKNQTHQRPYIILKWAESADGYMDRIRKDGTPAKLSTDLTNMVVHKKRSEASAIMVGTQTALLDNPILNVRNWSGTNPVRVLIDQTLRLPRPLLHLFDKQIQTYVFTAREKKSADNLTFITIDFEKNMLNQIVNEIYKRNLSTLLVEGGSSLHQSFIEANLWDEIHIERSQDTLIRGIPAPKIKGNAVRTEERHFGVNYDIYYNYQS
ncbi:MAG: bifunctional diaminohydroxyphosphoribosylaminopyrimidine deaminase/5-amino-6-(5-phosphoribosylamino)uracil reductase RibD [Bacteroidales bacterium]|nr:bifunctional diaminohydroxyphosphoribosylaminopyrimidine deaminase/5-amino-6-(5-phosphoribosylamino)uracil reductase RibD [Bacteroidales bacterium]